MIAMIAKLAGVRARVYAGVEVQAFGRQARVHMEAEDEDGDGDPEVHTAIFHDEPEEAGRPTTQPVWEGKAEVPAGSLLAPVIGAVIAGSKKLPKKARDLLPTIPLLP